jgi:CRP-like cAMP-binding protein
MELFKKKIQSYVSVDEAEMAEILSAFKDIKIEPGENLIEENTVCKHYYFLEHGLLRLAYYTKDKDQTAWVIFEGVFFTEIISMKSKKPTYIRIEALETCRILAITEENLNKLSDKIKPFEKYLRLTWEENLYHVIQMKLLQQFSSAKERYETLLNNKNLMQRIPQKYLASILGITPYSLSRLRNPKKT